MDQSWPRDWELLFRVADVAWGRLNQECSVQERRQDYFRERALPPTASSEQESSRIRPDLEEIWTTTAARWAGLYDAWSRDRTHFVFEDGYSVLFLIRLLWANEKVLLRGHYDSTWTLTTSLERDSQRGRPFLEHARALGKEFLEALAKMPGIRRAYAGSICESHQQAILQHYGFPTDLLDFTSSFDVALFFAEGGSDRLRPPDQEVATGSIYAVPTYMLPAQARLVTLPPEVMRPSLQRGTFIAGMPEEERQRMERFKFVFRHQFLPVWNGLGDIQFGGPVGLGSYLFPVSDSLEEIAKSFRRRLAGY